MKNAFAESRQRLSGLHLAILLGFGIVAVAAAYWTIGRGPAILARNDNPRLVEEELRVQRGTIYDVNMSPLAVTGEETGELSRSYPLPSAAPAVGYYSFRHGTSGVEQEYDQLLRGKSDDYWSNFWHLETLGEPQIGRDVRLTLDSRWQAKANELLVGHNGAVLLFSLPDVAVRAMASQPGYDPNNLEADFESLMADQEAPLLNRVTQGQYQPGLLLQPFLLAVAQRDGLIELSETAAGATREVQVDGVPLSCQGSGGSELNSWADVLNGRCPGPMQALGQQMGVDRLLEALAEFGLIGPADSSDDGSLDTGTVAADAGLLAIGQDVTAVNPLQIGIALAALANGGWLDDSQLVAATQNDQGQWVTTEVGGSGAQVVPEDVANEILAEFTRADGVMEQEIVVLSGPEGDTNSWYLGLAPVENPRYGVVVVVENDNDQSAAAEIGRDLLKTVLNPE